jgi:hypothetical protein
METPLPKALNMEVFAGREGSTFTIIKTGIPGAMDQSFGPVDLELTDVEDRSNEVVDAFSVLFRGSKAQEFGQANYRLEHEALGEIDLFLVPIFDPQPCDNRICYQAVVNRLRK